VAKYYIDTEFNGFGGEIISFALVREDGAYLSLVFDCLKPVQWVRENVIPHLYAGPVSHTEKTIPVSSAGPLIATFLFGDSNPVVLADWPDDIRFFCELIMTGPGTMVGIKNLVFQMARGLDAYPTTLKGAVHHNAYWDAMALRELFVK
jgi:hypothetical protein